MGVSGEQAMKIQYASDLHLEFSDNTAWLREHPLKVAGEVLVLAGDIGVFGHASYTAHPFWDWASGQYRQVIVLPGNHEFYLNYDLDTMIDGWQLEIRKNVHCRYNAVVPLADGIDLIVTTLWAKIGEPHAKMTERCVADFHRIMHGSKRLNVDRFNAEHERCFRFLRDAVAASRARHIVVVTHHVPSYLLTAQTFVGSLINGAFTVELGGFIESSPIECWIYGHSHRNIDSVIGTTRCLSNQLGYVAHGEHRTFDTGKVIEIG